MEHVFVYGTLRQGEGNHHYLVDSIRVSLSAKASGRLVDTGNGFPALLQQSDSWVYGELYAVDSETMFRLDQLEGYYGPGERGNHYERINTQIETDRGIFSAWTYVYSSDRDNGGHQTIEECDWKLYRMGMRSEISYFAYGSCMDLKRMEIAGVQDFFREVEGRGILKGFNLQFTRQAADGGRADIVETGGHTEGKVYSVPIEAINGYLYHREGVHSGIYRAIVIPVLMAEGTVHDCLTYVLVNKGEETTPPNSYMEEILRGAKPIVSPAYYDGLVDRFVSRFGYPIKDEELV